MKNKGLKFFFIFATAILADCVSATTIEQHYQDLNAAYITVLSQINPEYTDLPLPVNGSYKQAELQLLKNIISYRPQTKELVLQYLDSNPLLSKLYENNEGYKDAIADSVLRRSLELSNRKTPTYNELLGDVDPRTQIDYYSHGENPDSKFIQVVKNDILIPLDKLLHTDFMDKNKVARAKEESMKKLSSFDLNAQTAVYKYKILENLNNEVKKLSERANRFTEEGRLAQLRLDAAQAKIIVFKSSLTDADVTAFRRYGDDYLREEAHLNLIKDRERDVNPRYIEDVQNDIEEAEFNQYMNLKYGNSSIADNATDISFLKDYVGHWFKTKFIHLLQVLIAWIIVGVTVIWSIRKIIKLWHKR